MRTNTVNNIEGYNWREGRFFKRNLSGKKLLQYIKHHLRGIEYTFYISGDSNIEELNLDINRKEYNKHKKQINILYCRLLDNEYFLRVNIQ